MSDSSYASDASARVAAILERAEARARALGEQAERSAAEIQRSARHEAEGIARESRRAAAAAARRRADEIEELRASIAARAGSLVDGLEGGELTAARLAELVAALGEAAERILAEVPGAAAEAASAGAAPVESRAGSVRGAPPPAASPGHAAEPAVERPAEPVAASGPDVPEGAPMARRPRRRASTARTQAVLMAIQGSGREEVAELLAREHGLEDPAELLDDVFGRADTPA